MKKLDKDAAKSRVKSMLGSIYRAETIIDMDKSAIDLLTKPKLNNNENCNDQRRGEDPTGTSK